MTSYGRSIFHVLLISLLFTLLLSSPSQAQTWTGNGPLSKNIRAVAQSPSNSNILFAGAFGWGVFKSTNGGVAWINQKTGMTNTYVRSVLALNDNIVFAGTNDGVFKSIDGGSTWTLSLSTANSVRSLTYDAVMNSLYAATYGSGLYKSTNQGSSWSSLTVSDPVSFQTLTHQRAVTMFGRDSLYVGGAIADIASGGALFKSIDGGVNWIQVQRGTGIRSSVMSIAINPLSTASSLIIGTAAKGVYQSINGGTNWTNIDGTTVTDLGINAVGYNVSQYYAGTDSAGLFYYRTKGSPDWFAAAGLPGIQAVINSIKISNTDTSVVFVGTEGKGAYRSTDRGLNWQALNTGMMGLAGRVVKVNGNGNILLGTEFGDGIWLSTNQATSWVRADSLSTSNSVTAFGLTTNASILYAGLYGSGVYKSTDAGHQWKITDSTVLSHYVRTLSVHATDMNTVYAGTGGGVFKTTNGGTSWFSVNNGVPSTTSIRSMTLDKANPNVVYAGTDSSYLYKTTNGGTSWVQYTNANGFLAQDIFIRTITVDYNFSNIVYVGADSGRIYKSTNSGSSWSLITQLPTTNSVRTILMNPTNRKVFFAATFGGGIFVSPDSCLHWSTYNTGLTDLEVYSLESDNATPLNLYAGTGKNGVFHTTYSFVEHAPVLTPIGTKTFLAGLQSSFVISATDADFTIPSLSVLGAPSGATFYDSSNGRGRFTWSPSSLDIGSHVMTFIASDGLLADSEIVTVNVIDSSGATVVNVEMEEGWNMVSVPVVVNDYLKTTLFPSAASAAFSYQGGYSPKDTLKNGPGYWLKYSANQAVDLGGMIMTLDSIDVNQRWNVVGSLSSPIPVSHVKSVSPVTISSAFYGFSNITGYTSADTLKPGKAYWVKVSEAGKVVLDTAAPNMSPVIQSTPGNWADKRLTISSFGCLTFTDARGRTRSLYLSPERLNNIDEFELPPLPPVDVFDVRFESQRTVASPQRAEESVNIKGAAYPVKISWDVRSGQFGWMLKTLDGGTQTSQALVGESAEIVLDHPVSLKFEFTSNGGDIGISPKEYALERNYPNPFNPSTQIRYSLLNEGRVSLKVYNVLGQVVSTLVDEVQIAGHHSVVLDGAELSSGVYYYVLRVNDLSDGTLRFQSLKNMVLLK